MATKKCRTCGSKIIEYPIWEGQELGEPFEFSKINWYNLLVGDWTKLLLFLTILLVAWSYAHDIAALDKIYQNPCTFVEKNYPVCQLAHQQDKEVGFGNFTTLELNITT